MLKKDIKVPNIGEFKNVEVVEVLVKKGQIIKKDDPLITIESDKSTVEIPATDEGKILSINLKVGDNVSEDDKILEIETYENLKSVDNDKLIKKQIEEKTFIENVPVKKKKDNHQNVIKHDISTPVSASPKVRKFARELGVNINKIQGSERKGRVTEDDIKLFVSTQSNQKIEKTNKEKIQSEYSHSEFGEVEIKDIPRVKKISSKYLINSWTNIPHVTNHDEADITDLEEFRTSLTDIYTGEKKKITPLAFIVKALTTSLKKFPNFNSSIDEIESGKITIKKYYHIGIAVDTPHGLMVPKLRNADNKNLSLIGVELKKLSEECRNLKIDKKELYGGSMTITSLGGIGGSFFTPIINYPEVAILGIGKSQKKTNIF